MKLGAHISAAGGLSKVIDRAQAIGAETIQIFASSPRSWAFHHIPEDQVQMFHCQSQLAEISPIFLHGSYLVNIGGTPDLILKSINSLCQSMEVASQIGAEGIIFHCGSHKGVGFDGILEQATATLHKVLSNSPDDVSVILENSAGMGAHIGSSFKEIGRLVAAIDSDRVMVCLDTQHCFAAGYNIARPEGVDSLVEEFEREVGLSRLVAIHANDSKVKSGSGVDRHENIGEGLIGLSGFEAIMSHPAFHSLPFLLEVPGQLRKGPDKENLDRLKRIRTSLGLDT